MQYLENWFLASLFTNEDKAEIEVERLQILRINLINEIDKKLNSL
jgi:hypothetical protein